MTRPLLTVALLLLAPCLAAAAVPTSPGDLAIRARAVFKKHCAECHDNASGKPPLPLLDHANLVAVREKQLPNYILPKMADKSLIWQLVEDGSMPPASQKPLTDEEKRDLKAWITADGIGAPYYPKQFDDETILTALIADVPKDAAAAKTTRYLTLHHLVTDDGSLPDLQASRQAVEKALKRVSTGSAATLVPVPNTAETLLRLDLAPVGWAENKFVTVKIDKNPEDDKTEPGNAAFNLFDLVLLEYPYGTPPDSAKVYATQVTNTFLNPTKQVRPIPFVRADWFANALSDDRLVADLRLLLGFKATDKPGPPVLFPEAKPVVNFLSQPVSVPPGAFAPIDGYYAADPPARSNAPDVAVEAMKPLKDKLVKATEIAQEAPFVPAITASEDVFFELIYAEAENTIFVIRQHEFVPEKWPTSKTPQPLYYIVKDPATKEEEKRNWYIGKNTPPDSQERFILFYSKDVMPKGVKVRFGDDKKPRQIERYYHPTPQDDPKALFRISRTSTKWRVVPK